MEITVCSERSSCPCLCSGVDGKSVSRPVGSWNFQGAFPVKEKYRPRSAAMDFVGWSKRQNESGVLRGGKFFRGLFLTEVVGLTVITNHFLWLCSKWTRPHLVDGFRPIHKISGICDREYHGSQGASRWFCKIYCGKALIVGLIGGCLSCFFYLQLQW